MPRFVPPEGPSAVQLITDLGLVAQGIYATLEERLAQRIRALLSENLPLPEEAEARRALIEQMQAEARRAMAELSPDVAEDIVRIAATSSTIAGSRKLGLIPGFIEPAARMPPASLGAVAAIAADLRNRLDQLHLRVLRYPEDLYQRIIAGAAPLVASGAATVVEAQRAAVRQFLSEGITGFVDVSGRNWRIGTYAEMATRTAAMRAWTAAADEQLLGVGIGLVSVVIGVEACEPCAMWSGRILSIDGTPAGTYEMQHATEDRTIQVEVAATLDEARAQGWQHPNCRCSTVAYLPGLSIAGASTTYNAEEEAARARLRELEVEVRSTKRKLQATDDPAERAALNQDVRDLQKAIRRHVEEHNVQRSPWREQLWWADGTTARGVQGSVKVQPGDKWTHQHERRTAERLAALGQNVTKVIHHPEWGGADIYMGGATWEMKSVTSSQLGKLDTRIGEAARQARRIVIDLHGSDIKLVDALTRAAASLERYGGAELVLLHREGSYHIDTTGTREWKAV